MYAHPETHLRHHKLRTDELQRAAATQRLARELIRDRRVRAASAIARYAVSTQRFRPRSSRPAAATT